MKKIKLTKDEKELFDILRSTIKVVSPNTTLRAAGGWVRDKILEKTSDDIDFMVDNVSGEAIAKLIASHLKISGPHVVEANPDASKHLETAGMKIPVSSGYVFDLDFAMARQEVYNDTSRIPEIKPATPKEDAFRRDLTINSLFYNIMTGEIEDFTGKGLKDLEDNVMRTPENPLKTFQDDPLRIFRVIRFVARYNGKLDPETLSAMSDPSLRDAIQTKVKKERIQQELVKTFQGPNPTVAANLLKQTGIFKDILDQAIKGTKFEGKMAPFDMNQNNPYHDLNVWDHTMKVMEHILPFYEDSDKDKKAIMVISALMHDLGKLFYDIHVDKGDKTSYHGHEDASAELSSLILQYLKFNNNYIEQISKIAQYHMQIHELERDPNLKSESKIHSRMRRMIRKMLADNVSVIDIMNHSIADSYAKGVNIDPKVIQKYNDIKNTLISVLENMTIEGNKFIPILNGKEIMDILGIKQGPIIGKVLNYVKELMDDNPDITKEEAGQAILEFYHNETLSETLDKKASSCPKQLVESKIEKIKRCIKEENYTKAIAFLSEFKNESDGDDRACAEIAKLMLNILIKDKTQINLEILNHIFKNSDKIYFDTELCIPTLGILLLIKTGVKTDAIEEILERMNNMDNRNLNRLIDSLPEDCYHKKIIERFKNERKN